MALEKTIFRLALMLVTLAGSPLTLWSQHEHEVALAQSIKRVNLKDIPGHLTIQGTTESKISIIVEGFKVDEETRNLQPLYATGKNTGLGLAVDEGEDEVSISGLSGKGGQRYTLMIPENIPLKITWRGEHFFGNVKIDGHKGSIEMRRINGKMTLNDVTGPLSLYAMDAKLEVTLAEENVKGPISISTFHSDIKLRLNAGIGADLKMGSGKGELFSEFEIEDKAFQQKGDDCVDCNPRLMTGKLNGGGVSFTLTSYAGNIYLLKQN